MLASREYPAKQQSIKMANEEVKALRDHVDYGARLLDGQIPELKDVNTQPQQQYQVREKASTTPEAERIGALEEDLERYQQGNEAFRKALREMGESITAVTRGNLNKKVQVDSVEIDPEIIKFKRVSLLLLQPVSQVIFRSA